MALAIVSVGILATSSVTFGDSARPPAAQGSFGAGPLAQSFATANIATSQLYGGYAVVQAKSVAAIAGDWKIPKVHRKCPLGTIQMAFVGISLGGFSTLGLADAVTETECSFGVASYVSIIGIGTTSYSSPLTVAGGDQMVASMT